MDTTRWLRGNTHTHSTRSDGDASARQVVEFYASRGYDFIALTDHNRWLTPAEAARVVTPPGFVLIGGSELSYKCDGTDKPVDVCALGGLGDDPPARRVVRVGQSPWETAQAAVDAAVAAGGLPVVNHPTWRWALSGENLLTVRGRWLLEIWNPSSGCNSVPVAGVESPEDIWDRLLSSGRCVWGVAADDAHRLARPASPPLDAGGVAWIRVGAEARTSAAILEAMSAGRFYCSTGVELDAWSPGPEEYGLAVRTDGDRRYCIRLFGADGVELMRTNEPRVSYRPAGDEMYIRARVEDTMGARCWTQPWMLAR
ncbi:MAG: hypothetical protein BIFFINMI_03739 [Phycisphaerae bacterium]|nr:hypothetical protein [Phycisphaerae bacterium]